MPYSKERRDEAIRSGGFPLDAFPGYAAWAFRMFVESRGPVLKALCEMHRGRELEIQASWCKHAKTDAWAWDEARGQLLRLVARGEVPPLPLAKFAIVPRPPARSGPGPDAARSVKMEFMARSLQEEGLEPSEVVEVFTEAFPELGRRHADSTLRKRRGKGRPYVGTVPAEPAAPENQEGDAQGDEDGARLVALDYDWREPVEAARVLLTSGWPALALLWELWPEHREARVAMWFERARCEPWMWDEFSSFFDHAVYCRWPRYQALKEFISCPRPGTPRNRRPKFGLRVRLAAVEHRLRDHRASRRDARQHCTKSLGAFFDKLDSSTVAKHFFSGREELRRLISLDIA